MPSIPDNLPVEISNKYGIVNNAFIGKDKGEKHDELEVEIGDIHSDSFQPQFKIKRWDNECNFSVRLVDDKTDLPKLQTKNNKIKFIKKKIEAHFYDIPKTEESTECFEFEIILKEKPTTNKVQMSIETKGLAFHYQPELTQEEIDEGCHRPENVIGSYAVYHESKTGDYHKMGLKNYRAGKAFHIFRPSIIDNAGTEVWGKLNIDVKKKLLTVELPQDFLDNAVYPIRHAAGLTFGYESKGGTAYSFASTGRTIALTFPASGTAQSITGYVKNTGTSYTKFAFGLYTGAITANPIARVDYTVESDQDVDDWVTLNVTQNYSFVGGAGHIFMYGEPSGGTDFYGYYDAGATNEMWTTSEYNSQAAYVHPPAASMPRISSYDRKLSIYCTYTTAAGTAIPVFLHLHNQMRQ